MFIKIIDHEVVKGFNENGRCVNETINTIEHNYEVTNYSLFPTLPGQKGEQAVDDYYTEEVTKIGSIRTNFPIREINLSLQFIDSNKGWDKVFSFPVEVKDRVTEVYVMNNNGRTMEKYSF